MSVENSIEIFRITIDLAKTLIPFGAIFFIFWLFRSEIKELIKRGGLKVSGPGFSLETLFQQQKRGDKPTKRKIAVLNTEVETAKKTDQKLQNLQDYTTKEKDAFFLGYHFEKTYRIIFPSQMAILNNMQNADFPEVVAEALFRRTIWAQQFKITYGQFIGFLESSGFIQRDNKNQKLILTPLGKAFWQYLLQNKIPLKLPANDFVSNQSL